MRLVTYIFASCKSWHRPGFEALRHQDSNEWLWAASPEELLHNLETHPNVRYIFFVHWNWHVPREIWSRYECVCFHMTDVPYGRGGSPLQNLIAAGHKSTKLSALRMVDEMDAGPVYGKREMCLDGRAEDIYLRAGKLSVEMIQWLVKNEPEPQPQQGKVVMFKRRRPEQSVLPSQGELVVLYDHIRMLDAPTYPPAFLEYGSFKLEFSNAQMVNDEIVARVVIRKKPTQ